jgi:hypothetical protein
LKTLLKENMKKSVLKKRTPKYLLSLAAGILIVSKRKIHFTLFALILAVGGAAQTINIKGDGDYLSAFLNTNDVNLTWATNEKNISHYIIQRSMDGKSYSDIAVVFANDVPGACTYKYKDVKVSSYAVSVFYRLKAVGKNKEECIYSSPRNIRLTKETETLKLITYPNPVVEQVKITLPSSWQGKPVILELYNRNGNLIQSIQFENAGKTEAIQLEKILKGFYMVRAICNGEVAQQRFIKN